MATIYTASDENISLLSKYLLAGEIVAVPTETVYGLAANAFNDAACARVFEAKGRPSFDPLIVHLPPGYDLGRVAESNALAARLIDMFWPGPLTVVLKKNPAIPDLITAGLDSVAVRMPRHPVFQRLLQACRFPLAAPSANPFSYVSPTSAAHVEASLGSRIPHILDGGPCEIGVESTIIDARDPSCPLLLRPGALPLEEVSERLGVHIAVRAPTDSREVMPGQLKKHYSPRSICSLRFRIDPRNAVQTPDTAYLFFAKPEPDIASGRNIFWLSEKGTAAEAARNLFRTLRQIDNEGFSSLVAEKAPDHGLGLAINDRLARASAED